MRITLPNNEFLAILARLKGAAESRTLDAVGSPLSMVKAVPSDDGCAFLSCGSSIAEFRCFSDNVKIEDPQEALIPISKMYEICRNAGESAEISLNFSEKDSEHGEASRRVDVSFSGDKSRYTLVSLPSEDYPDAEDDKKNIGISLRKDDMAYLFAMVSFSMAKHDPRHYLNGLLLEHEGKTLTAVATDGHRLARSVLKVEQESADKVEVIMPRQLVQEIEKNFQDKSDAAVTIRLSQKQIKVGFDGNTIIAQALTGQFPDYRRVISDEFSKEAVADRQEMLESLSRAGAILVDSGGDRAVTLSFSGKGASFHATSPEGDVAEVEQGVEYSGDAIELGFNITYLVEALKVLQTEKVRIRIRDASSGVRITGEGGGEEDYIVMPLRL